MFRLILFFMFVVSAQMSFGAEKKQQAEVVKVVILSDAQKLNLEQKRKQEEDRKQLVAAYDKLSDAIATNDLSAVEALFKQNPELKNYAHHNEGTPLHFARSIAMAQLLIEKIGFDASRCDEWGEMPSKTILATKDQFFAHVQEKALISAYLSSREKRFAKIYFQLKNNKNIHRKAALTATTILLLTFDYYLLQVGLLPLPIKHQPPHSPVSWS